MTRENSMTIRTQASQERLQNRKQGMKDRLDARQQEMKDRLEARRKIKEVVDDLSQRPERPMPTLRPEEPRGGIPSRRGYVERAYQPGSGGGTAGIASPLTEGAAASAGTPVFDREFYDRSTYYANDYLLAVEMRPLRRIRMRDANGAAVELHFAEPDPYAP